MNLTQCRCVDESKKTTKKPADEGDAEADEHDLIAMPSMRVVTNGNISFSSSWN